MIASGNMAKPPHNPLLPFGSVGTAVGEAVEIGVDELDDVDGGTGDGVRVGGSTVNEGFVVCDAVVVGEGIRVGVINASGGRSPKRKTPSPLVPA